MRRVLFLAGTIVFLDTLLFAALTPLLPHFAHQFHLSKAGAGLLAASYPIGVLTGGLPSGIAATRAGVKGTAIAALTLMAGASVAFGLGGSIVVLDLARFSQGIASSFAWTAALTWMIRLAPAERRGELIGAALGVAIGGALFGPAAGALASLTGTRPVFAAVAGLCVLAIGLGLRTPAPSTAAQRSFPRLHDALLDSRIAGGLWLVALPALLFGTQSVLVPLRLSALGVGAAAIGGMYVGATALEAVAAPLVGRLSDRRGRRLPVLFALAGSAVLVATLPWPRWPVLLALLAVAAVIFFGLSWAPAMSHVTHAAEARGLDPVWAVVLINMAWAPGQALGSVGGGSLARATSDAVVYLLLSGLCAVTFIAVRRA